jgi:hypothetical protein
MSKNAMFMIDVTSDSNISNAAVVLSNRICVMAVGLVLNDRGAGLKVGHHFARMLQDLQQRHQQAAQIAVAVGHQ